jgi:hypothetical protein
MADVGGLKVGYDENKLKDTSERGGKTLADGLIKHIQRGADKASKIYQDSLGKDALGAFKPQVLERTVATGLREVIKTAKYKDAAALMSKNLAGTMSKTLGTDLDPKAIERVLTRGLQAADTEVQRKVGKQGLVTTMLFGKRGEQGALEATKQTAANAGGILAHGVAAQFGRPGQIVGSAISAIPEVGLLGSAALGGAALAAYGLSSTVSYGKELEEHNLRLSSRFGTAGGVRRQGMGDVFAAGRGARFSMDETAGMAAGAGQAGLGAGAMRPVMRAERAYGVGGDLTAFLGAQVQRGARYGGEGGNRQAMREYGTIVGVAVATKLETGRMGEVFRGLAQMTRERGIGMRVDADAAAAGLIAVGGAFRGEEGITALRGLETAGTGGKTPLGRTVALQVAGLGRDQYDFGGYQGAAAGAGGDIFKAERQMELGFFGEAFGQKGTGIAGAKEYAGRFKELQGYKGALGTEQQDAQQEMLRGQVLKNLSLNMGLSQNAVQAMMHAIESGKATEQDVAKIAKAGQSKEAQAYEAMIEMATFKTLTTELESLQAKSWTLLGPLISTVVKKTTEGVALLGVGVERLDRILNLMPGGQEARRLEQQEATALESSETAALGVYAKMGEDVRARALAEVISTAERQTQASLAKDEPEEAEKSRRQEAIATYFQQKHELPALGLAGVEQLKGANVREGLVEASRGGWNEGFTRADMLEFTARLTDMLGKVAHTVSVQSQSETTVKVLAPPGHAAEAETTSAIRTSAPAMTGSHTAPPGGHGTR